MRCCDSPEGVSRFAGVSSILDLHPRQGKVAHEPASEAPARTFLSGHAGNEPDDSGVDS